MVGHHASFALNWVRGTLPLTLTKSKKFCVGSWDGNADAASASTVGRRSLRMVERRGADERRLEEPSSGVVSLHARPLPSYDVLALRRRVGMLQQAPVILEPTVLADLRLGRPALSAEEAAHLLERVGLDPTLFLERATEGLSGGEAQRVCLARALAVGPEVMLLDEPTSALDSFAAANVEAAVRALLTDGLSVVMVSHDLRQARRIADQVVVLMAGRVAAHGPADEVLASTDSDVQRFLAGAS